MAEGEPLPNATAICPGDRPRAPFAALPTASCPPRRMGHAVGAGGGLCAEPGVSHHHGHHGDGLAGRVRAVGTGAGGVCRGVCVCLWHHAAVHGHRHRPVRRAAHPAGGVSAHHCGRGVVGIGAGLWHGAAGAGADRRGLRARIFGVHRVHRALLSRVAVCHGVGRGHGGGRAGHAVYRHAPGLAGAAVVLAHGVWRAGGPGGAGLAADLLEGA